MANCKKIVVTGASGFLGRAVVFHLEQAGIDAIAVSRHPIAGMLRVSNYFETPEAEILIHLAEEPDRAKANRSDSSYAGHATEIVRTLCKRARRVIYASSGMVYGDEGSMPFKPDILTHGSDLYSRLKIENENIVNEAGGTVLRLSNLYGRGMSPNNVVSEILRQIPGIGVLSVRDDQPIRDFVAVADAATAFVLAARTNYRGVLNVGSGVGISIRALAQLALQTANEAGREVVAAQPSKRRSINILDVSDTHQHLGWSASTSVADYFSQVLGHGAQGG